MKRTETYNSDSAWGEKIEINLADKSNLQTILTSRSLRPFSKVTVEVICVGATGTSGSIKLKESMNTSGTPSYVLPTSPAVATGVTSNNISSYETLGAEFLVLDMEGVTFGAVGTMIIKILAKR